jgi:hypothetical protein
LVVRFAVFLVARRFAVLRAGRFFAVRFLAVLRAVFFAARFFAGRFFAVLRAVFFAARFFAGRFLAAFFTERFLAGALRFAAFLAVRFLAAAFFFFAGLRAAGLGAAGFGDDDGAAVAEGIDGVDGSHGRGGGGLGVPPPSGGLGGQVDDMRRSLQTSAARVILFSKLQESVTRTRRNEQDAAGGYENDWPQPQLR